MNGRNKYHYRAMLRYKFQEKKIHAVSGLVAIRKNNRLPLQWVEI
jgi:hypothetical protein